MQVGSPADDIAIASDAEDDDDVEDDDSDWEDVQSDEKKRPSQSVFKRVDSTANLRSRRWSVPTADLIEGSQEVMSPGFEAKNEDDSEMSMAFVDSGGADGRDDAQEPRSSTSHKGERECYMCQETVMNLRKRDWQYFSQRLSRVLY